MALTKEQWLNALEKRHGKETQKKFLSSTVAVCGLGGLGSNIAIALARAGVGRLILIDFDRVDVSNLNRQQYKIEQIGLYKTEAIADNLREIAPFTEIVCHNCFVNESNAKILLSDADVICEAFDNAECKAMLTNTVLEKMSEKYLVAASGMAGFGSANNIKTRKIAEKFYLCGDGVSDVNDGIGLVASRVMICAAHQAHIALQILSDTIDI